MKEKNRPGQGGGNSSSSSSSSSCPHPGGPTGSAADRRRAPAAIRQDEKEGEKETEKSALRKTASRHMDGQYGYLGWMLWMDRDGGAAARGLTG